jgi:acyl-CoA synthetase (NDP forming)
MNLKKLFYPKSLAVVGASNKEGKLGYNVLRNLITHGYQGEIFPVNSNGGDIQGYRSYQSVSDIDAELDAAVTIVPASATPQVVEECFQCGIEHVTVEAAGFGETGERGKVIEGELRRLVREYGGHILGPNCTGIINVNNGLCESIGLVGELRPGNVGLVAQAGVYAAGILWGLRNIMDFSLIATIGNKLDIDETDVLEFMGQDDTVKVIVMYLEDIRDGERFLRVAKRIANRKPIILLKGGRTDEGKAKAVTHTAAMGGSSQAYDAIFREAGVIRATDNDHMFDLARAFSKQPLPPTDRMMVITYSGSQGITATDTLNENGMRLATLGKKTREELRDCIPNVVTAINPADLTFDQNPAQVRRIIEIVSKDAEVGGIIANIQPELLDQYAQEMRLLENGGKPVLFSATGKEFVMEEAIFMESLGFPVFGTPERAAQVLSSMRSFATMEVGQDDDKTFEVNSDEVKRILQEAKGSRVRALGGMSALQVLEAYGIPTVECQLAHGPEEADRIGKRMSGPIAMKIESEKVLHKSDLGGVELNVEGGYASVFNRIVKRALRKLPDLLPEDIDGVCMQPMVGDGKEVIIGSSRERAMDCHVVKFGLGGKYTEVFRDLSNRIAPLSENQAKQMIGETRFIGKLLKGQRGEAPYRVDIVVEALLRLSQLVRDFPEIEEIEANPFLVTREGGVVVDARLSIG